MPSIFTTPAGSNRSTACLWLVVSLLILLGSGACREMPEAPVRRVPPSRQSSPLFPSNGIESTIAASPGFTPKPVGDEKDLEPVQDQLDPAPGAEAPAVVPGDAPVAAVPRPVPESSAPSDPGDDGEAIPTPATAPKSVRNGRYYVKGVASGRCLDMPFGDAFGYPLIIWDCTKSDTQVFTLEHVADKYFKIFSPYLRTAEVRDGVAKLGAVLQQGNGYVDGDYQKFEFELQIDKLTYMIRIHGTDLAWQVSGDATVNGTVMVVGKAAASSHERFTLIPVP